MLEEIYALAASFAGAGSGDEGLRALCKAAECELAARLRPGVTPEDCRDSFICAAAWMALAGYGTAGESCGEFSVADVTVRPGGGAAAQTLRSQAETLMAPWCGGGFSFRGVRA